MMEVFLVVVVCILLIAVVAVAALVYKTSLHAVDALERQHERTTKYTEGLIDRITSGDFGTFKAQQQAERLVTLPPPSEEYEEEEWETIDPVRNPDRGGFGSRLGLRALSVREEQAFDEFDEETA
jgi:hypothetical protein